MHEKEIEARELLDELYSKIDNGGLDNWEQPIFDVLTSLLEDGDKPELD